MTADIAAITEAATKRVLARTTADRWAACGLLWVKLWAKGESAWLRWPDEAGRIFDALCIGLARAGGLPAPSSVELALIRLEGLDIEDDGSADWQHVVDLAAMLIQVLGDDDIDTCVEGTVRTYLEGTFNVFANELAEQDGGSVSHAVALRALEGSPAWHDAVSLVAAL